MEVSNSLRTHTVPAHRRYQPWEFMLDVDEVNYSIAEQLHVINSRLAPLRNLASGVNFVTPPTLFMEEVARALLYPVFYQDYDGYKGSIIGRRAIQCFETARSVSGSCLSDNHIMITCGAGAALHLLGLYYGDNYTGDEILIPVPTFPLVGATMKAAGLQVREVTHAGSGRFLPLVSEFETALTERTQLIYINLFNNPTGEYYSHEELTQLVALTKKQGITLLVDRVSSDLDISGSLPNILDIAAEQNYLEGVVIVSSLSKDRGLPGLRVGWIIGSPQLIERLASYNSLITMSSPTLGGAVLYIDMLCRSIIFKASFLHENIAQYADSHSHYFYERIAPLLNLIPDLEDFLKPLRDAAHVASLVGQYLFWQNSLKSLLKQNWELLRNAYADVFVGGIEWKGDFNTFIHIPLLDGIPIYDTTIALFRQNGLQLLPGPVFGFDTGYWEQHGFWTRLSFAMPEEIWHQGLVTLYESVLHVRQVRKTTG